MANRIPNFTQGEKEVLFNLALEHANILEDKKTNRTTIDKKNEVWKQIETAFNNRAPFVSYRKADQLKRLYENKKKDLRKKLSEYKNQIYKTGGGPPPDEPKLDPMEEILIKIINEKTVFGFAAPFDSDTVICKDSSQQNIQVYKFSPTAESAQPNTNYNCDEFSTASECEIFDIPDFSQKIDAVSDSTNPHENHTTCFTSRTDSRPMSMVVDIPEKENRHPPYDLERPISKKLKHPTSSQATVSGSRNSLKKTPLAYNPTHNRRRPMAGVRVLTSSDVAEKYNLLLDKRVLLVDKQIQQSCNEEKSFKEAQEYKLKILKQQSENLSLEKEEKLLKIELLKAELKYKQAIISSNI